MSHLTETEAFEGLIDALVRLSHDVPAEAKLVLETTAETLLELKTADALHEAIFTLQETLIARHVKERDHWKANHDAQVERARVLHERTDLPLERVRAYEYVCGLAEENAQLRDSNEALQQMLNEARGKLGMLRETLGVAASPYRSLFARMVDAARDVGIQK